MFEDACFTSMTGQGDRFSDVADQYLLWGREPRPAPLCEFWSHYAEDKSIVAVRTRRLNQAPRGRNRRRVRV